MWDLERVVLAQRGNYEDALREIPWQKSETYLNTEKCYQILYEIEV